MTKESEKFTKAWNKKHGSSQLSKKLLRKKRKKEQNKRQGFRQLMEQEREIIALTVDQEMEVARQLRANQVSLGNTDDV